MIEFIEYTLGVIILFSCVAAGWITLVPLSKFIVKIIPDEKPFWGFLLWYLYVLRIGAATYIGFFYSLFVLYFFTFIGLFSDWREDLEEMFKLLYFFN